MLVSLFMFHSKDMRKFLIRIVAFFAIIVIADVVFGKVMFYAESQSSSKNYHCMYKADEDILILGSSYAVRDIVPSVIEDSLGLSCYNAGEAGNGAIVAWARYNMFLKNHTPRLIIYTLTPEYDYVKSDAYSKYLNIVKPYYGKEDSIAEMYSVLMDRKEGLILNSNFMKFNSYGAQLIYRWLTKKNEGKQGYEPLYETFIPYDTNDKGERNEYEKDVEKKNYLEVLFRDIKNRQIPILCLLPPDYRKNLDLYRYVEGLQLCKQYDIPVINHKYFEGISQNAQYFYDMGHLNDKGARFYTKFLCEEFQKILDK